MPGLPRHGPGGRRLPTGGAAVDLAAFRLTVLRDRVASLMAGTDDPAAGTDHQVAGE